MWKVYVGQIKILQKESALSLSLALTREFLALPLAAFILCSIFNGVNICCGKTAPWGFVEEPSVICTSVGSVLPSTDMIQFQSLLMCVFSCRICCPLSCWTLILCRNWSECHTILLLVRLLYSVCSLEHRHLSFVFFSLGFFSPSYPQEYNIPDVEECCHFLCTVSGRVMQIVYSTRLSCKRMKFPQSWKNIP